MSPHTRQVVTSLGVLWFTLALATSGGLAQSYTITTIAGRPGAFGANDGTGEAARFSAIMGLAIDSAGTLVVSDNQMVRKVTSAGVVTTLAGLAGSSGYTDATGASARFKFPAALVVDAAGNIFVGDGGNAVVRKISPAGAVTTLVANVGFPGAVGGGANPFALPGIWRIEGGMGLAFSPAGTEFYAAEGRFIRKIDWSSRESILAGQRDVSGSKDGTGTGASFGLIGGLAVDSAGNLYATDMLFHTVRKVTASGVVTTLAGLAETAGAVDGTGSVARFNQPRGLAVDRQGNILVADEGNNALRRITPAGVVTTVAGGRDTRSPFADGVGAQAGLNGIRGVAIDRSGTIFLAVGSAVRKALDLPVAPVILSSPENQVVPSGQGALFTVAANGNPNVTYQWQRQSNGSAIWSNIVDGSTYGGTTTATLIIKSIGPGLQGESYRCVVSNSLGTTASAGATLEVAPPVVVVPLRVAAFAGRPGAGNGGHKDEVGLQARFAFPQAAAVDRLGNIYVADSGNNRVRRITPFGSVKTLAGSGALGAADGTGTAAQFSQPAGIALSAQGDLFVADSMNGNIRKVTPAGVVTTLLKLRLGAPAGIVVERAGTLLVADRTAHAIFRVSLDGTANLLAGIPGLPGSADGTRTDARFNGPTGLTIDAAGMLYVADAANNTVRKVTPEGVVTTLAGQPGLAGSRDGLGRNARFNYPSGLAINAAGHLYVADTANHQIRKIASNGIVTTVLGVAPSAANSDSSGISDGTGEAARLNRPFGIALDPAGNIYVVDSLNHAVRKANAVDFVREGESVVLSALALAENSGASSFQWQKDGADLAGATTTRYEIAAAQSSDDAEYSVKVATTGGIATSQRTRVSVVGSRLANLAIRSAAGSGAQTLIVGFVVRGSAVPLLVRGVGPGLRTFGISSSLTAARLSLFRGEDLLTTTAAWGDSPDVAAAGARLGAFALTEGSLDAAVLTALDDGAYTAQCSAAAGASGIALIELYDASTAVTGRLVNVSARTFVGTGEDTMIAGFSIEGGRPRRLLIRGIGPALTPFGVSGVLSDPELKLYTQQASLRARNDNWEDGPDAEGIAKAARSAGGFALPSGSRDSALLVTLEPGTFSVHLSGVGGGVGVALIEIYEQP